jgi:hypothetical protein
LAKIPCETCTPRRSARRPVQLPPRRRRDAPSHSEGGRAQVPGVLRQPRVHRPHELREVRRTPDALGGLGEVRCHEQLEVKIEADDYHDDGLLPWRFNEWCPWCPILESCGVVEHVTDYALTRIAALAPEEKQGARPS